MASMLISSFLGSSATKATFAPKVRNYTAALRIAYDCPCDPSVAANAQDACCACCEY